MLEARLFQFFRAVLEKPFCCFARKRIFCCLLKIYICKKDKFVLYQWEKLYVAGYQVLVILRFDCRTAKVVRHLNYLAKNVRCSAKLRHRLTI